MNNSFVKNEYFSYEKLKEKARREIRRLIEAEKKLEEENVMDYALNAAFSVYHLLQWRDKTSNPESNKTAHELCKEAKNQGLIMLHGIVTCNKHMTVGDSLSDRTHLDVAVSANINHLVTEKGDFLVTEKGDYIVTEDSKVVVKFDDKKAVEVLNEAMKEFD